MTTHEQLLQAKLQRIDRSHRCRRGTTALLVVDMQHAFLDPGASLEVPQGRVIVPNIARLIDVCRRQDAPVVFTEFVYQTAVPCLRGDPFGPEHLPRPADSGGGYGSPSSNCLIGPQSGAGAESPETIGDLAPRPDELVVRAHTYDKFYGTPLDLAMRCRNIDRLLVSGVTTDICVNATVIAAATRNYRVTAVSDGVATLDETLHQSCLRIWQNKFARIRCTEEVIDELNAL
jgi:ureidoacrylate peracid hydrolase